MGRVTESFEFASQDGREFHVDLGFNSDERRVIVIYGRIVGGREWRPILELDIDFEPYHREPNVDLPPPRTQP